MAACVALRDRQDSTGSLCTARILPNPSVQNSFDIDVCICILLCVMASSPPTRPDPAAFDRRAWITLLVLCGVLFLDGLDVSMVGVALPSIDSDLNLSTSTLQWIV